MHCVPTTNLQELKALINDAITYQEGVPVILNSESLEQHIMMQLACNCLYANGDVLKESQTLVWQICQSLGTPYTACDSLVSCLKRDGISEMIVPIVDANWIPFELLCTILAAGKEMEVGPLIFAVDKSDPDYRAFICQVLCAAVKENWQAPVLFYDGANTLPIETVNLDWKKMLYFNSYELPHAPLESLMGKMLRARFEDLSPDDWKRLAKIPPEHWSELRNEIYLIYCDLFEELDMNETFPVLKRYVIPEWIKDDIFETI
jgi:hypothetical protein